MKMSLDDKQQQLPNAIEPSQSSTLPTETVTVILLKLPVESLLRCKSVCKLWFSLISDPRFVTSHLNLHAHRRLVFTIGTFSNILSTCCLNDMMDGNNMFNALEEFDYPLKNATKYVKVVGSINGLLCLRVNLPNNDYDYHGTLFLCNPSTRKFTTLPSDAYRTNVMPAHFGFGYDESTDDYKVVAIVLSSRYVNDRFKDEILVKIYSLKNGCWKDFHNFGAFPYSTSLDLFGKFLNGALHWAACNGGHWKIVSLDLATETFGEVTQPVYDEEDKMDHKTLRILGEWLCVLCGYSKIRVDVWAMKVYGLKDSWTKLFSIPNMNGQWRLDLFLEPLCILSDGRILLLLVHKLKIYDSKDSSFSDVQYFDKYTRIEASTFVESLVSLMPPSS